MPNGPKVPCVLFLNEFEGETPIDMDSIRKETGIEMVEKVNALSGLGVSEGFEALVKDILSKKEALLSGIQMEDLWEGSIKLKAKKHATTTPSAADNLLDKKMN